MVRRAASRGGLPLPGRLGRMVRRAASRGGLPLPGRLGQRALWEEQRDRVANQAQPLAHGERWAEVELLALL